MLNMKEVEIAKEYILGYLKAHGKDTESYERILNSIQYDEIKYNESVHLVLKTEQTNIIRNFKNIPAMYIPVVTKEGNILRHLIVNRNIVQPLEEENVETFYILQIIPEMLKAMFSSFDKATENMTIGISKIPMSFRKTMIYRADNDGKYKIVNDALLQLLTIFIYREMSKNYILFVREVLDSVETEFLPTDFTALQTLRILNAVIYNNMYNIDKVYDMLESGDVSIYSNELYRKMQCTMDQLEIFFMMSQDLSLKEQLDNLEGSKYWKRNIYVHFLMKLRYTYLYSSKNEIEKKTRDSYFIGTFSENIFAFLIRDVLEYLNIKR